MYKLTLLFAVAALIAAGCEKKEDPTKRPGFVDTSDPSKVSTTMEATPKNKGGGNLIQPGPGAPKPGGK